MFRVTPLPPRLPGSPAPSTSTPPPPLSRPNAPEMRIGQGQFFAYALPPGWVVGEDGQYALTLLAPDRRALTLMVGNAGVPIQYPPAQFVYEKLMALRPDSLQLGQPQPAAPVAGFQFATVFEVSYTVQGAPCRGIAQCHIAPAYDSCVMAVTAALAETTQWPAYAGWLPLVANQISAINGAAFGARGVMQQNLGNSMAYAEAARQYRDWSQRNWQATVDQRAQSEVRRNFGFRENLGAGLTYTNPYDSRLTVELPHTYAHYWVNRQGEILGSNDPSENPNTGSTADWTQMPRYRP